MRMTEREVQVVVQENCALVLSTSVDEIADLMVGFTQEDDYGVECEKVVDNCYMNFIEYNRRIPLFSDVVEAIFDDYSNRQYAISTIQCAEEYDYSTLSHAEFNAIVENLVTSNMDCDSYGGYLNYDEMVACYYDMNDTPQGVIKLTDNGANFDISNFMYYVKNFSMADNTVAKIEAIYDSGAFEEVVAGDCQQVLIPEFINENCYTNSYRELCVVGDKKAHTLKLKGA